MKARTLGSVLQGKSGGDVRRSRVYYQAMFWYVYVWEYARGHPIIRAISCR